MLCMLLASCSNLSIKVNNILMNFVSSRNLSDGDVQHTFVLLNFSISDAISGQATFWQYAFRATKDATSRHATYWYAFNWNSSNSATTYWCVIYL